MMVFRLIPFENSEAGLGVLKNEIYGTFGARVMVVVRVDKR